jgi:hypothetical protein
MFSPLDLLHFIAIQFHPFGNGLIVNRSDQIPTTIQPFGNRTIIGAPGLMPRFCQPLGAGHDAQLVCSPTWQSQLASPFAAVFSNLLGMADHQGRSRGSASSLSLTGSS